MNTLLTLHTDYLRADRSIDTLLLQNGNNHQTLWVYNFEGVHFRVFSQVTQLMAFFHHAAEADYSFEEEKDLDDFLLHYPLSTE
jgi:hypothetical protein